MIGLLSSLTNRIFLASALLAIAAIGTATYVVNVRVTAEAERELRRGLQEAGELFEQYRLTLLRHLAQQARLIADLPKFKAAVDLNDPPTLQPLAEGYQREIESDVFLVTGPTGRILAHAGLDDITPAEVAVHEAIGSALRGVERTTYWRRADTLLQVVSVPIWIDPSLPEILGSLSVGIRLDGAFAAQFQDLTDSEIAFASDGHILASTLPPALTPRLESELGRPGTATRVLLDETEYVMLVRRLTDEAGDRAADDLREAPTALLLRSRSDRLRFLGSLQTELAGTAVVALLVATLLSYLVARTVTRPLGAITAAMRQMAATGDLAREVPVPAETTWPDEDARLLAKTLNVMTESIARFQAEAAQRERLSSLGRFSTVLAHEIRNPLMIIKAAVRRLRRQGVEPAALGAVADDIGEEVARLDRLVDEVLDFARPIRPTLEEASLEAICASAVAAAGAGGDGGPAVRLRTDPRVGPLVTDAERLRRALVNLLVNARQAVMERDGAGGEPSADDAPVELVTERAPDGASVRIVVRDRGRGIPPGEVSRVFEPFFTTRKTGSGIGLAIARNIIESLGGTIEVESSMGRGTSMSIELPLRGPAGERAAAPSSSVISA